MIDEDDVRSAYLDTCCHSNGAKLDDVLGNDNGVVIKGWHHQKVDAVTQTIAALQTKTPWFMCIRNANGGIQHWELHYVIGGYNVIAGEYRFPFTDCFPFSSVEGFVSWLNDRERDVRRDMLKELIGDLV